MSHEKLCECCSLPTNREVPIIKYTEKDLCKCCRLPNCLPIPRVNICAKCEESISVHSMEQNRVKMMLDKNNFKYAFYEKTISTLDLINKADFIVDRKLIKVVLEIDEYQKLDHANESELKRMKQIQQDLCNDNSVLFLRYNPRKYTNDNGKNCTARAGRESKLIDLIKRLDNITEWPKTLSVIYLCYDGYNGRPDIIDLSSS